MITKTQYVLGHIGLIFVFFASGYAVGYGIGAAFLGKGVGWLLLAGAGFAAYTLAVNLQGTLTRAWQRQKIGKLVEDAWHKALDELRARGDIT